MGSISDAYLRGHIVGREDVLRMKDSESYFFMRQNFTCQDDGRLYPSVLENVVDGSMWFGSRLDELKRIGKGGGVSQWTASMAEDGANLRCHGVVVELAYDGGLQRLCMRHPDGSSWSASSHRLLRERRSYLKMRATARKQAVTITPKREEVYILLRG